ncbi:MAG: alpha/beta hydrolase [Candidatus Thorarchaeota archaeon]|nr:alpha/beta hydrolase [Candidatus Thorarchaeota archaeon]
MAALETKRLVTDNGTIVYHVYRNPDQTMVNLYVHGLGDNRKWFPKHFSTYALDRFSWIVPDLLGHGDSTKSDEAEAYTMDQQADYLAAILEKEDIKRLSILAHSMGGAIAASLIELLAHQETLKARPSLLFYLEGNLDAGDAFFSSQIAKMTFSEFEGQFDSWCDKILGDSKEEPMLNFVTAFRKAGPFTIWASSKSLAPISMKGDLLGRLLAHQGISMYFIFGEKNKGVFSSESLVRKANLPLLFIPEAGHGLHTENPPVFWKIVCELIQQESNQIQE